MPARTEIVITIGEVLDCLPPGKAFKRRRYNSFDANTVGNEENLAPGFSGVRSMKPVKIETEDDDEVSFRNGDSLAEDEGSRSCNKKRKTSAEKFLEDNANYFQLEVLSSKTRSNKQISNNCDSCEDDEGGKEEGFHNSFLDFLKSKGVEKEDTVGRSRHKSAEMECGREGRSRTFGNRSMSSSNSPYQRSRSTNREPNGRSKSRGRSKSKVKAEDHSASESESDSKISRSSRRCRKTLREMSPSGSEAESVISRPASRRSRRGKAAVESEEVSSDDDSKSRTSSPTLKPSPRKKRSELDKLLEAVDTSFHFESAKAERKRLNDTGLGPLEIDCSDTGSEASCNVVNKRKVSECHLESEEESRLKRQKVGNNLLKTASPGLASNNVKNEEAPSDSGAESEFDGSGAAWDGWDALADQLQSITHSPVEIDRLHFSFETEPYQESWYSTYQRQDKGDEIVFYPTSTTAPFLLPYELPYAMFLPVKNGDKSRQSETPLGSRSQSKAPSPVRQTASTISNKKGKSRKVSESESTDSEDLRRGRGVRPPVKGKAPVLALPPHLLEPNYRVSPRQHASTKSFLTGGEGDGAAGELDELAEAYIMRDEAELHFPNLTFLPPAEDSNDSYSSESIKSRNQVPSNRILETGSEMSNLAASIDKIMMGDLAVTRGPDDPTLAAKIPPTRSRVSSDQLLSPKKMKKKRKLQSESVSPLDQHVADNVDPVLLDCLEDELPTVPVDDLLSDPLDLLETYSRCTSMAVCNKRWLKPSKPSKPETTTTAVISQQPAVPSPVKPNKPKRKFIYKDDLPGFSIDSDMEVEKMPVSKRRPKEEPPKVVEPVTKPEVNHVSCEEEEPKPKKRGPSPSKKIVDPSKPKRIIIYKDDLPGFEVLPDSDAEPEKLPVSKRGNKQGTKAIKKKFKIQKPVKDKQDQDEDNVSVESFSSTSSGPKKKRKMNRTGFPSPKKKKLCFKKDEVFMQGSPKSKADKSPVKNCLKSPKGNAMSSTVSPLKSSTNDTGTTKKKSVSKQVKLDRFITKTNKSKTNQTESSSNKSNESLATADSNKRSATLKTKNYSELESDTESLLEVPLVKGLVKPLTKKLKVALEPLGKSTGKLKK